MGISRSEVGGRWREERLNLKLGIGGFWELGVFGIFCHGRFFGGIFGTWGLAGAPGGVPRLQV